MQESFGFKSQNVRRKEGEGLTGVAAASCRAAVRGVLISLTHVVLNIYVGLNK